MIIVDQDSSITYWNRAAEKMFGYTSAEILGQCLVHGSYSDAVS